MLSFRHATGGRGATPSWASQGEPRRRRHAPKVERVCVNESIKDADEIRWKAARLRRKSSLTKYQFVSESGEQGWAGWDGMESLRRDEDKQEVTGNEGVSACSFVESTKGG